MKIWNILPKVSDDLVTQLLTNRGLKGEKEISDFFNPDLSHYEKDINIPNIKKAQERILKAIEKEELIVIFGDYDVDGICASALLYKALTSLKARVLPYIPHREKEGYGLNKLGLEFARDSGASVVITVDNGIVAFEGAEYAKTLGIDLIVTDHHVKGEKDPESLTIVHSVKMCGTAVAWCLIQSLLSENLRKKLLELVAIATVCDMMPLIGVNRAFLVEGLKVLKRTDNIGIIELARAASLDLNNISSFDIGFLLGPRLNAIGRLDHAIDALRLLCTKDITKARKLADLLCEANTKRKILTDTYVADARIMAQKIEQKKIFILDSAEWDQGIIGLIAGRICEEYFRPVIAISSAGGEIAKGSARSVNGLNIVESIRECADLLVAIGGHSGAAGFSIETKNIEKFKERLEKIIEKKIIEESKAVLDIDAEVPKKLLNKSLLKEINTFAPFGYGNPQPILALKNIHLSDLRTLSEGKHLKGAIDNIDVIGFNFGNLFSALINNPLIDIAFTLEINEFRGVEKLQLKLKDIQLN